MKKMGTHAARLAALATALPLFAQAAGEHFTFTVPYATHALGPEIRSMRITCSVLGAGGADDVIAIADQDFSIPAGGDTGSRTATLRFNASPGKDPSKAVRYRCAMYEPFNKPIALDPRNPSRTEVTGPIGSAKP
jgi:hypothetical protein